MQWNVDDRLPRHESRFLIEVWNGRSVRTVRRIGFRESGTLSPGTLVYTDCTHPLQNMLCDESAVMGWRYLARPIQAVPRETITAANRLYGRS